MSSFFDTTPPISNRPPHNYPPTFQPSTFNLLPWRHNTLAAIIVSPATSPLPIILLLVRSFFSSSDHNNHSRYLQISGNVGVLLDNPLYHPPHQS
ncbi:hypothetical protein HanIR_Chr12g0611561 [Helianthus annuus]|nr:hypothetical protein HanIR_Chr12g0611561 [Helianthus annuus]